MTFPRSYFASLFAIAALVATCVFVSSVTHADDFSDALEAVRAVNKEGKGHASAVQAMSVLNNASPEQIPLLLKAMDGSNKIALNWLRGAVNQAVQRNPDKIPRDAILKYFSNEQHSAMGRLLAFDLLTAGDEKLAAEMTAKLIDDPSLPLRYKAIAKLMGEAEKAMEANQVMAAGKLTFALSKARNIEQIQNIAGKLKKMGVEINLRDQLGLLSTWHLVGCFDNKDMKGFEVAYGPEADPTKVDLEATYEDQDGKATAWKQVTTPDSIGNVNLNEVIGKVKGATVYAYATFKADDEQKAQFRIGSANATKIWLNGKLVMSNEVYHNSNSLDKFIGDVTLSKGKNEILIKVCQNEQTQPWAQDWQFQFRICDESGKAIPEFVPAKTQY